MTKAQTNVIDQRLGSDNWMICCLDGYSRAVPPDLLDALREEFSRPAPGPSESIKAQYLGPRVRLPNGAVIKLARGLQAGERFDPREVGYVMIRAPERESELTRMDINYKPGYVKPEGVVEIWDTAITSIPKALEDEYPVKWPRFSQRPARLVIEACLLYLGLNVRVKVTQPTDENRNAIPGLWHVARHGAWWNWEQKQVDIGGEDAFERPAHRPLKKESKHGWETFKVNEVRFYENVAESSLRSSFASWKRARRITWKISFKTLRPGWVWAKRKAISEAVTQTMLADGYTPDEVESNNNRSALLRVAAARQVRLAEERRQRQVDEAREAEIKEALRKELLG